MPARKESMPESQRGFAVRRFQLGLGERQIARSCGMGLGMVDQYLERAVGGWNPLAVRRKAWAKKNWKPSCLGVSLCSPQRCDNGRNRTGKRFTSNSSSIGI